MEVDPLMRLDTPPSGENVGKEGCPHAPPNAENVGKEGCPHTPPSGGNVRREGCPYTPPSGENVGKEGYPHTPPSGRNGGNEGYPHTPPSGENDGNEGYFHLATTSTRPAVNSFPWHPIPFMVKSTNKIQRYNDRLRNMRLFQPLGYGFGILMVLE